MKKIITFLLIASLAHRGIAQVVITPGAQWVNTGNVTVTLTNTDLVVDGSFEPGNGTMRFTGNQNSSISGVNAVNLNILDIAKSNNAKLVLQRPVNVGYSINFITGLVDLNNQSILLAPTAYLAGETENNRITGLNGGYIEIIQDMNAPFAANPGNLGAIITSNANLGSVTIRRGHNALSGTGLTTGIFRHFNILPANNNSLDATVRINYFDAELNAQTESNLVQFKSPDNGTNWTNESFTSRDATINYVEKTGHHSMSVFTLAAENIEEPPPSADGVTGLVFKAKRKKPSEVELTWTTATEINMNGFEVQRRLMNEPDFSVRTFVNTKAVGGNSATLLSYLYKDVNSYTDTSYYRLRIVDNNGGFTYSEIRAVLAKPKGGGNDGGNGNNRQTEDVVKTNPVLNSGAATITVGPNPNNGNFWFMVTGIETETPATLYTIDGKVLKQFKIVNQQQQKVNGLGNGMYIIKVPGINALKVVVQGSSVPAGSAPAVPQVIKY